MALLAARLRAAGVRLVLCQKLVPPGAAAILWEEGGVLALRQLSNRHFGAACALSGCAPLADWRTLAALDEAEATRAVRGCAGALASVEFVRRDGRGWTVLRGPGRGVGTALPAAAIATVALPLSTAGAWRAVSPGAAAVQALDSLRLLLSEPLVAPGAGAAEAGVAAALLGAAAVLGSIPDLQLRQSAAVCGALAASLLDCAAALNGRSPSCSHGAERMAGLQCGLCACRRWGRDWALTKTGSAAGAGAQAAPGRLLVFPRLDGLGAVASPQPACARGPADRCVHGAAACWLEAPDAAAAGGVARAVLEPGTRVLPIRREGGGGFAALVLPPRAGSLVLDGAGTLRRALLRAVESAGICLRVDGELMPKEQLDAGTARANARRGAAGLSYPVVTPW